MCQRKLQKCEGFLNLLKMRNLTAILLILIPGIWLIECNLNMLPFLTLQALSNVSLHSLSKQCIFGKLEKAEITYSNNRAVLCNFLIIIATIKHHHLHTYRRTPLPLPPKNKKGNKKQKLAIKCLLTSNP